jgi:hypothetical protein
VWKQNHVKEHFKDDEWNSTCKRISCDGFVTPFPISLTPPIIWNITFYMLCKKKFHLFHSYLNYLSQTASGILVGEIPEKPRRKCIRLRILFHFLPLDAEE